MAVSPEWTRTSPPNYVERAHALLGRTVDEGRVWDVIATHRHCQALAPRWKVVGRGPAGILAAYASLFEPEIARLDLWYPPASHQQGPTFLNVRRILDMPQAVALAFPRQVRLYVKDDVEARAWDWPLRLQKALGQEFLHIRKVGPEVISVPNSEEVGFPERIPAPRIDE